MKIKLKTGQKMTVLAILPYGSFGQGTMVKGSDVDVICIYKWDNQGEILGEFPLHVDKNSNMFEELTTNSRVMGVTSSLKGDLDIKFVEVSSMVKNIQVHQSVDYLELLDRKPLYFNSGWGNANVLSYELFNREQYLSMMLGKIHSRFGRHVVPKNSKKTFENLASALYLVYRYMNQDMTRDLPNSLNIDTKIFVSYMSKEQIDTIKSLKRVKQNDDLYINVKQQIEEFLETHPRGTLSTPKSDEPYNTWLGVVRGGMEFDLNYLYSSSIGHFKYDFEARQLTIGWKRKEPNTVGYVYAKEPEEIRRLIIIGSLGRACQSLGRSVKGTPVVLDEPC